MKEAPMTTRQAALQLLSVRCLKPLISLRFVGASYVFQEDLARDGVRPGAYYQILSWFSDEMGTCVGLTNDHGDTIMLPIDEFEPCVRLVEGGKSATAARVVLVQGGRG
jgi:hypothetical protein